MMLSYTYKDKAGNPQTSTIDNPNLISEINEAQDNYQLAKKLIHSELYYIWRWSLQMYHLSTSHRKVEANLKDWQSNIAFGLIRSFIDVFISTLVENPIVFMVKGITEKGLENADKIRHALATSADVTGYQQEARIIMAEGLKVGVFTLEVSYLPEAGKKKYSTIKTIDGVETPEEVEFTTEIGGFPQAKHVSVFELFPDPANSIPRYVTRRTVVSHKDFTTTFKALIDSKNNESPFKSEEFIASLVINPNSADMLNYGSVRNEVHKEINDGFGKHFSSAKQTQQDLSHVNGSQFADEDAKIMKGMVEYKYYTTDARIVLFANDYPVYVGPNEYGFIPFEIQSVTDPQYSMDCEGIPYRLAGMEKTINSFMNNYLDSVRAVSSPILVGLKGAFLDEQAIEEVGPGDVLWAETQVGAGALRRLELGSVSDFNILDICFRIASQLTGISEYNLGISAGERTAAGALATTQSSLKRLSPFLATFMTLTSRVATKFLILMRQNWVDDKYLAASGSNKIESAETIRNINLDGVVDVTLNIESMQSAIDEFAHKKLLEVYAQGRGLGILDEKAVFSQMFKSQGLEPTKYVLPDAPQVTTPPNSFGAVTPSSGNPAVDMGREIAAATSFQPNLGNGGEGVPA